jgi:hypothetical protein
MRLQYVACETEEKDLPDLQDDPHHEVLRTGNVTSIRGDTQLVSEFGQPPIQPRKYQ